MAITKVGTGDRTTDVILILVLAIIILGGLYIVTSNLFKIPDPIKDLLEAQKKAVEDKIKALERLKLKPGVQVTLADTKEKAKGMANGIAIILRQKLEGYTSEDDHRFIYTLFKKKLKTSNDIRLLVKAFGVFKGQTLVEYIASEYMPKEWKEYILSRLAQALPKAK